VRLVVGLGNPGRKYEETRHNAGFWFVERYAARAGIVLRNDAKFQAFVGRHEASGAWLILPQAYMNASGRPVQMLAGFFKIPAAEILVAHDELDFPPGTIRLKQGGGVAGHNGLRDISARLGTHDYWRLRIGIGHPGSRDMVTHYLLNTHPQKDERATIDAALDRAIEVMPLILAGDVQSAMLKLHTQEKPAKAVSDKPAAPEAPARQNNSAPGQ
jgi:PTH1 family peptidyl-tRNA hydrolase